MNHRHLLPNEIDLLVDGEVGFGIAPLRAHVDACPDCRARLEEARVVVDEIEHLGRFAPSPAFADRVMSQVHVFVPPQVAARESIRRWMPSSRPARVVVGAFAGSFALVLTAASLWLVSQLDLLVFFSGMALDRLRTTMLAWLGDAAAAAFGEPAANVIRAAGAAGLAVAALMLLFVAALATFGLRAAVTASGRRRG